MFHLGPLDISILVGYLVLLGSIGWWAAHRSAKTTADYFLAGRSIPWLVTTASFMATIISALTFIGTPAEGYGGDYRYLFSSVGDILATIFVAACFLPVFQRMGVTSIYELIAHRFGGVASTTCSGYFLVARMLAASVRIVAVAKVLEVVSNDAFSYKWCVVIVIGIILTYTTVGGGRAIAWTDLVQFILLISGAIIAIVYIVNHVPGGVPKIIEIGKHAVRPDGTEYSKFNFLELFKPTNLGLFFLIATWGFFQSSAAYGTDQDMVQRLLSCSDPRKARWSLMLSGLISIPVTFLFLSIGVALYAYAQVHPELVLGMTDNDHIFPRFIVTEMPAGLRGLLLAAVASAAMGSSDSALASLATAFVVDFYKPFWGKHQSESHHVRASKIAFIGFGLLMMISAIAIGSFENLLWLGFKVVSFMYAPLLGVFFVAIFTNWKIKGQKLALLMIMISFLLCALLIMAKSVVSDGATDGIWFHYNATYWRLNMIVGSLLVPLACYFLRDRSRGKDESAS